MSDLVQDRLNKLLDILNISIKDLSLRSGIPYRTLQNYLYGKSAPDINNLKKLSDNINISIDWLVSGNGEIFLNKSSGNDDLIDKVTIMLKDMNEEQKRKVLLYVEDQKLLDELKGKRAGKKVG
jgi:transcriptional regulator with XRE-family HTH domain